MELIEFINLMYNKKLKLAIPYSLIFIYLPYLPIKQLRAAYPHSRN